MTSPAPQYGTIPFDIFALEQWDYSLPLDRDDAQWSDIVAKYLSLTPLERFPYHRASNVLSAEVLLDEEDETDPINSRLLSLLTTTNTARVLAVENGHQTQQERAISALRCGAFCDNPLWLRICYRPELSDRYRALAAAAETGGDGDGSVDDVMVLDDVGRYDAAVVGADVDGLVAALMEKIPGFCDGLQGSVVEDYEDWGGGGGEEEEETALESASRRAAGLVYLVDEEAVEDYVVKLLWLDVHGRCVWRNKVLPGELMGLSGAFKGGYSLSEAVESHGLFRNPGE